MPPQQLVMILGLIGMVGGAALAWDTRIDSKISHQVAPIRDDVKAIRNLLETFLLSQIEK